MVGVSLHIFRYITVQLELFLIIWQINENCSSSLPFKNELNYNIPYCFPILCVTVIFPEKNKQKKTVTSEGSDHVFKS